MIKVYERIFVGTEADCRNGDGAWCVVHACKSPCHQRAVRYRGNLPNTHPNYLVLENENDLYLNIIDPPVPLFKLDIFTQFISYAYNHWSTGQNILIHCNQGESRAPTLALLLMAKRLNVLPAASYQEATKAFMCIYQGYKPGRGIQTFLIQNWDIIG